MGVSSISRNSLAPIIEVQDDDGNVVQAARVDIRESIDADKLSDIREFVYVQGDSWGNVAYTQLGDARHWWVIAELSNVLDPFTALTAGVKLKTPSPETLFLEILTGG